MTSCPPDRRPPYLPSLLRGLRRRCPACGQGHLFGSYLKLADRCDHCGETLGHIRADDAPPYFTIVAVTKIVGGLAFTAERLAPPPLWVHLAVTLPAALLLTLALLPFIKGGVAAVIWSLGIDVDDPSASQTDGEAPAPTPR